MAETVLIVEDDQDIVELLSLYLTGSGYDVVTAGNGEDALEQLQQHPADIALVDIMMPRMNGYDFIKALRATDNIPVIIISARTQAADKIVGLDAGADGFIAKPFNPLEVTAQIRALLRRRATDVADALAAAGRTAPTADEARATAPSEGEASLPGPDASGPSDRAAAESAPAPSTPSQDGAHVLRVGDLAFDTERLELFKGGTPIPLTAAELKIMATFMAAPGRVFSKAQLYACINGESFAGSEASVMVHVSNIRAKLEDDPLRPAYIKTIRGMGYKIDG
ncbi:MAG TPA: response regulator transcription factor [Enorma massiliensis]|uniref:response regulator transcription factor n=1 Tax=Enorma massiliensis TaxID=1472761 RepID=UPI001DDF8A29|nr:response regulator transcription factor [Enorma massiliensis]HJG63149.1 response regulator transcription factor [Enorma massiliensis]